MAFDPDLMNTADRASNEAPGSVHQRIEPCGQRVDVANSELFTVRDAMRELNRIVGRLQSGDLDQAVLMKGTKMVAVIRAVW